MRFLGLGIVETRLRILVLDLALLTVNLIGPVDSLVKNRTNSRGFQAAKKSCVNLVSDVWSRTQLAYQTSDM